jgi:hypothetical protein
MTLIVTYLDRNGIVLASDSNLTDGARVTRESKKNFCLPHLCGGLSIAGCYTVDGVPMEEWINNLISEHENHEQQSLCSFANVLRMALDSSMNRFEKEVPTIFHIAGYASANQTFHPEFHSVRNVARIHEVTGEYFEVSDTFQWSEDFWSRDCLCKDSHTGFPADPFVYGHQIYTNGYPPGRMAYMAVGSYLGSFFENVWKAPNLPFRPPTSLQETVVFTRMFMTIIHCLFELSDAPRHIGGEIQHISIPLPMNR